MGKLKKQVKPVADDQKKISNFFQPGAAKPQAGSGLFTELGKPAAKSKLSLKKVNSFSSKPSSDNCLIDLTNIDSIDKKTIKSSGADKTQENVQETSSGVLKRDSVSKVLKDTNSEQPGSFFFGSDCASGHVLESKSDSVSNYKKPNQPDDASSNEIYTKSSKLSFVGRCDGQVVRKHIDKLSCDDKQDNDHQIPECAKVDTSYSKTSKLSFVGRCDGFSPVQNDPDTIPETQEFLNPVSKSSEGEKYATSLSPANHEESALKEYSSSAIKTDSSPTYEKSKLKTHSSSRPSVVKGNGSSKHSKICTKTQKFTTISSKDNDSSKFTAEVSEHSKTPSSKSSNFESSQIIPDTPEDVLSEASRKRRVKIGRSFLTSSTAVSNPAGLIQRQGIDKNQKRKVTLARKSLIDVSVSFNPLKTEEWKENEKINDLEGNQLEVKDIDGTEKMEDKEDLDEEEDEKDCDDELVGLMEAQASIDHGIKDVDWGISSEGGIETDFEKIHNTAVTMEIDSEVVPTKLKSPQVESPPPEAETPTKIYDSGVLSIKRMSKSGLSPLAKKSNSTGSGSYGDSHSHKDALSDANDLNGRSGNMLLESTMNVNRVKRNLANHDSSSFSTLETGKPGNKKTNKNAQLKEKNKLTSFKPSFNYQLSMNRKMKKQTEKPDINLEQDDVLGELLGELNSKESGVKVTDIHDDDMQDSDLLLSKSNKDETKTPLPIMMPSKKFNRRVSNKGRQSTSSKSPGQLNNAPSSSLSITEEELDYFDQLDKDIHSGTNSNKNQKIKSTLQDKIEIERCVTPEPEIKATQEIKEFSTQAVIKNVPGGMEIESFSTPNSKLCRDIQDFSPFKTSDFEDSFRMDDEIPDRPACENFGRHVVDKVISGDDHSITLEVHDALDNAPRTCVLQGFWTDSHVCEGDVVHILAEFNSNGVCYIHDKAGLLVVNPDLLLSGTTVVSSVFCMRKSILKEKFKGCDSKNIQMLYGSIIHSVFQQVLRKKITEDEEILKETEAVLTQLKFINEMYSSSVTELQVMEEVKQYIPSLQKWLQQYTTSNKSNKKLDKGEDVFITEIKDIEENIWSPRFGVKGKIDLTVEIQKQKPKRHTVTVPLELKTGRASYSLEHKGQVTLYSMMSSDRRDDPRQGLLLYLKEPSMKTIAVDHLNMRGLIQLRNEMAYYISRQVRSSNEEGHTTYTLGSLPRPINNHRACSKCPQLLNCAAHHRIENRDLGPDHSLTTLSRTALEHLTATHLEYFMNWCVMMDLENQSNLRNGTRNIWCQTGSQRENIGECISGLMINGHEKDRGLPNEEMCSVTFTRHPLISSDNSRLDTIGLSAGDFVILSCEKPSLIALCTGTIHSLTDKDVTLITEGESLPRLLGLHEGYFRLDKYDGYSTAGMLYTNMSRLMGEDPHSTKLRCLIVDKAKPTFLSKLSKSQIEKVKAIFKPMNKPQKMVILKILMSEDYVLMKGYPGTGKTSTIVALVQVCRALGMSVLLTSYTHSAVDNILLKLSQKNVSFMRLGRLNKIHPKIKKYSAETLTRHCRTVADLRDVYGQQSVVATSCLGVGHPIFTQRKFDLCIVDEASQVLQPACLGPLFCAHKFVLVGDPKQLPPVVQCKEAREMGMSESLFQHLDKNGATFDLNLQYRMNRKIMALSNKLVYGGALQCGNEDVANAELQYKHTENLQQMIDKYSFLEEIFRKDKAAIFLDTKQVPALESRDKSGLIYNSTEADIVKLLVQALKEGHIDFENIGVIAPYRNQVTVIKERLSQYGAVEVNTVDQYQGRDKEVIMISFTRSFKSVAGEKDVKSGQLLKDVRRLNVAITRAKTKLILIGNTETLRNYQPLSTIISEMVGNQQMVDLPAGLDLDL